MFSCACSRLPAGSGLASSQHAHRRRGGRPLSRHRRHPRHRLQEQVPSHHLVLPSGAQLPIDWV